MTTSQVARNLTANSAPSVLTATGETVTAGGVSVTDTFGTIGTSCTSPFATSTASLTGVAAVSAYSATRQTR